MWVYLIIKYGGSMQHSISEFRTFNQFIRHACQLYKLGFKTAKSIILKKLHKVRLSPIAVVCYINWADNEFLTEQQIAQQLGITQQGVANQIQRLRKVWKFLPGRPKDCIGNKPLVINVISLTPKIINNAKMRKIWGVRTFTFTNTDEENGSVRDMESSAE